MSDDRLPVGTEVCTRWGHAVVIRDWWPDDPNYEIRYEDGSTGSFTSLSTRHFLSGCTQTAREAQ